MPGFCTFAIRLMVSWSVIIFGSPDGRSQMWPSWWGRRAREVLRCRGLGGWCAVWCSALEGAFVGTKHNHLDLKAARTLCCFWGTVNSYSLSCLNFHQICDIFRGLSILLTNFVMVWLNQKKPVFEVRTLKLVWGTLFLLPFGRACLHKRVSSEFNQCQPRWPYTCSSSCWFPPRTGFTLLVPQWGQTQASLSCSSPSSSQGQGHRKGTKSRSEILV